jgi:hypothetical protein
MAQTGMGQKETGSGGRGASGSGQQVKQQVQDTAQQVAGRTRWTLREQLDQRSTRAGEQLHGHADDVRSIAKELQDRGKEGPARLAEQGANYVERLGGYLRDADADRLLDDVEGFARSKPWMVAVGAAALGFAASRFMKASSQQRYQASQSSRATIPDGPVARPGPGPVHVPEAVGRGS